MFPGREASLQQQHVAADLDGADVVEPDLAGAARVAGDDPVVEDLGGRHRSGGQRGADGSASLQVGDQDDPEDQHRDSHQPARAGEGRQDRGGQGEQPDPHPEPAPSDRRPGVHRRQVRRPAGRDHHPPRRLIVLQPDAGLLHPRTPARAGADDVDRLLGEQLGRRQAGQEPPADLDGDDRPEVTHLADLGVGQRSSAGGAPHDSRPHRSRPPSPNQGDSASGPTAR